MHSNSLPLNLHKTCLPILEPTPYIQVTHFGTRTHTGTHFSTCTGVLTPVPIPALIWYPKLVGMVPDYPYPELVPEPIPGSRTWVLELGTRTRTHLLLPNYNSIRAVSSAIPGYF